MDKSTWNLLLTAAVPVVLILSLATLPAARPRRQVLAAFLPTLIVSSVIYPLVVESADTFHRAFVICAALALGFALLLIWLQPLWSRAATFSWALLGVVTPYSAFFLLLTAACWGQTECLG